MAMFGSVVLEVALGLVLTFSFFSVIMTSVREGVEAILKTRAKLLESTIGELLGGDPAAIERFYKQPAIYALFPGAYRSKGRHLPSYIPSANFAAAVIALAKAPEALPEAVKAAIAPALDPARAEGDKARADLEAWFDSAMDRVSGSYKRQTQLWLLGLGFAAAAIININPVLIGNRLARDQQVRADVAAFAPLILSPDAKSKDALAVTATQLQNVGLPVGWSARCQVANIFTLSAATDNGCYEAGDGLPKSIGGWLIAALAAMLGAPFWFDLLNRIVNLRTAIKPPKAEPAT
jgi:hypothetical protein